MRRTSALLLPLLLALISKTALADLASIHAAALPQETSVLGALDDARQLEPYVSTWTNTWNFPVTKDEATRRIEKDLGFLSVAFEKHPENAELAILTGVIAHFAYNLDISSSHEKAIAAFDVARKLAPSDIRGTWFHANLLCQTKENKTGAQEFLDVEAAHSWDQLPAAFWGDYMYCASVTNMPAHVLRAASYLDKLHAPPSQMRTFLADNARKRFDIFDPARKYDTKDVWQAIDSGEDTQFTSTLCGVRFTIPGKWTPNQLALSNGSCVAFFSTGPYKATTRDLRPSVMLMVQRAAPSETLNDYLKKFTQKGRFVPFIPSRCPSDPCVAMSGIQPGMYKADGDGHAHLLAFERDQPAFPALIFESPFALPKTSSAEGLQAFRPAQTQQRIPGKLFYLVLVDMAASIETPAMSDYDLFLKNLTVD